MDQQSNHMTTEIRRETEGLEKNTDWDRAAAYYDAYVWSTADIPFIVEQARWVGGPVLELKEIQFRTDLQNVLL